MHHDLGDLETAAKVVSPALAVCQSKSYPAWLVPALLITGSGKLAAGAVDEAIAMMREALAMCVAIGANTPRAYYLSYLVEAYLAKSDVGLAIETLETALASVRVNVEANCEPELLRLLGEAHFASGDRDSARARLLSARNLARARGAVLFELKAAASLGRMFGTDRERTALASMEARLRSALDFDQSASPMRHLSALLERIEP